jgi:predicted MPP superfamily phosphohydrolase
MRFSRRQLLFAFSAVVLGSGTREFLSGKEDLRLERVRLQLPRWSAGKVRVAFLTDWHLNEPPDRRRMTRAIELAVAEKPDLILLGGDYMSATQDWRLRMLAQNLRELKETRLPVAGVLGNHDYSAIHSERVPQAFTAAQVPLLRNGAVEFDGLQIVGVDDCLRGTPEPGFILNDRYEKNTICLLHEPDFLPTIPAGPSLVLSGHSHGGQICLPGGIPIRLPEGARDYPGGVYEREGRYIYVSRGIGMTGLRARMFCPPEVTILDLS